MVIIIFTREGLKDLQAEVADEISTIWHNPHLLTSTEHEQFQRQGITCQSLPRQIDVEDTKATLWALDYVEQSSADQEIMIEYP